MKIALDMAEASKKSNENSALEMMKMLAIKDTITLIEHRIEEAASYGIKSCENHIHEFAIEAVHSEFGKIGYSVQTIGVDPAAGSAHIKISW
jgi:hypothetical protein